MARQRFIHPTIWDDPDLGRVSLLAFTLYVGSFSNADDDGRLLGDAAYLKTQIFRYRNVSLEDVLKARDELVKACRSYVVYEHQGIEYVCFRNWDEFQKPKYPTPSKLPPPPGWKRRKPSKGKGKSSGNDSPSPSHSDSPRLPGTIPPQGWVGLGRDKKEGLGLPEETPEMTPAAPAALSGVAAGAFGTRAARPHGFECPHCGVVKAGPAALEEHIANVHYDRCPKCRVRMARGRTVAQHLYTVHGIGDDPDREPDREPDLEETA